MKISRQVASKLKQKSLFDGKKTKMTSFDASQSASAASYTNWSTVKGVRDDVNLIVGQTLKLFDDTQTLRIQHFQTVWKSMKFGLVSIKTPVCDY